MAETGRTMNAAMADVRLGWHVSAEDIAIAALVMLPFTLALILLVNAALWLPNVVSIVLAGLVQGVGTFWNAGWRARTSAPAVDD